VDSGIRDTPAPLTSQTCGSACRIIARTSPLACLIFKISRCIAESAAAGFQIGAAAIIFSSFAAIGCSGIRGKGTGVAQS